MFIKSFEYQVEACESDLLIPMIQRDRKQKKKKGYNDPKRLKIFK